MALPDIRRIAIVDGNGNIIGIFGSEMSVTITGTHDVNVANWPSPQVVAQNAAPVINIGQVTVPATANGIRVIAANAKRRKIKIFNTGNTPVYYYKDNTITTSNGTFTPGVAGYPFSTSYNGDIYAIVSSGTQVVTYLEECDS